MPLVAVNCSEMPIVRDPIVKNNGRTIVRRVVILSAVEEFFDSDIGRRTSDTPFRILDCERFSFSENVLHEIVHDQPIQRTVTLHE